jgi:YVTN family beta-propeller protein
MQQRSSDETYRGNNFIKLLTLSVLTILILVNIAGAEPFAYIGDESGNVTVTDTATDTIKAKVPVGGATGGFAVTQDGTKVYVGVVDGVSVINTATNKVIATVPLGVDPSRIAVTPDGTQLYAIAGGGMTGDAVYVINTTTNTVSANVPMSTSGGIAVTPDGTKVYVTCSGEEPNNDFISLINTTTNTVVATIDNLYYRSWDIDISPDGKKAYVVGIYNRVPSEVPEQVGKVSVIDTATNTVSTFNMGYNVWGLDISPDGKKVYIIGMDEISYDSEVVNVISTATNAITAKVPIMGAYDAGVTPDGSKVYVPTDEGISVINTTTNTVSNTLNIGTCYAFGKFIGPERTFKPNPNGWSFINPNGPFLLSISDFHNYYGVNVDPENNNSKEYLFYYYGFRYNNNIGNCFGMSTTSVLLYNHIINNAYSYSMSDPIPNAWKGFAPFYHDSLPVNIYDWIVSWQAIQLDKAILQEKADNAAVYNKSTGVYDRLPVVYNGLKEYLDPKDVIWVLFFKGDILTNNGTENFGHCVVPYKIEESSDGKYGYIYVYDSNYPGDTNRYFKIDLKSLNNIEYVNSPYITIDMISPVGIDTITKPPQIPDWFTIHVVKKSNEAHILYSDNLSRHLGYDHSVFEEEIPGTCSMKPCYGDNNNDTYEAYYVPDPSIKMELIGYGTGDSEVSMITPNGLIVANVPVSPTSVDEIKILNNGTGVYFNSENGTTPYLSLMVNVETPEISHVVNASISQIEKDGGVNLSNDNGTIVIQNNGLPRTINLLLKQTGTNPNSDDSLKNIVIEENSIVYIKPSNWNDIASSEVKIEHDIGSDGTIDYTETIRLNTISTLPVANFTTNVSEGNAPLTVQFTNLSTNATHLEWNFGDNSSNVSDENPEHLFTSTGLFNVVLTASNSNGSSSKNMTINVTDKPVTPILPVAGFIVDVKSGVAPLTVNFSDKSQFATSVNWDFNGDSIIDKSGPTGDQNYTYTTPGTYIVNQKVINANGTSSVTDTVIVTNSIMPVKANFTFSVNYLAVQFNDTSTGKTNNWTWNFGDSSESNSQNTSHTYANAGTYSVKLSVKNADGSTDNITKSVTVIAPNPPVSSLKINDFKADVTNGYEPLTVHFNSDVSGKPILWTWKFEKYFKQNFKVGTATHKFMDDGVYDITLTVKDAEGHTDTMTKKAYITVLKVMPPKTDFIANVTSGKKPLTVKFTDKSINNPKWWIWSFGDGQFSSQQNPVHIYKKAGKYTVTLTVRNYSGIDTKIVRNYITVNSNKNSR